MIRPLRSLAVFVALVLAASLTLAACGDKDEQVKTVGRAAPEASSSTMSELATKNFVAAIAAAQAKARTSHVSLDVGFSGQSITAEGDVRIGESAADTAMALTMDLASTGAGMLDIRLVEQKFYLNFGPMTQDKFVTIDLNDDSDPLSKQYGRILDQMDPSKQIEQFSKALTSLEKKGKPKTLDGVKTQPYVLTIDISKIEGFSDLGGAGAGAVPDTIAYTMYVGQDNLPRRVVAQVAGSQVSLDYSKWGMPVDIQAPGNDEISDQNLSELLSGGAPRPS